MMIIITLECLLPSWMKFDIWFPWYVRVYFETNKQRTKKKRNWNKFQIKRLLHTFLILINKSCAITVYSHHHHHQRSIDWPTESNQYWFATEIFKLSWLLLLSSMNDDKIYVSTEREKKPNSKPHSWFWKINGNKQQIEERKRGKKLPFFQWTLFGMFFFFYGFIHSFIFFLCIEQRIMMMMMMMIERWGKKQLLHNECIYVYFFLLQS